MNIKEAWDIVGSHVSCDDCLGYYGYSCDECEEARIIIENLVAAATKQYTKENNDGQNTVS